MSTPSNRRSARETWPQLPHTHTCAFRRKQRSSSSTHRRRASVRKSLKFEGESLVSSSSSSSVKKKDGGGTAKGNVQTKAEVAGCSSSGATSHALKQKKSEEPTPTPTLPLPHFWTNPPPPPSLSSYDADAITVNRRSMRIRTNTQFAIAQITDTSPNLRPEPVSDLVAKARNKTHTVGLRYDQCSDYGTSSESSLYFRPSSQSAFSLSSTASSFCKPQRRSHKATKNTQNSEPSSQSMGYASDLDEGLSNLSIDDAISNNNNSQLLGSKRWDSDEKIDDENSEWEHLLEAGDNHLRLDDLNLRKTPVFFTSHDEGISVLMPLEGYVIPRTPTFKESPLENRYYLRKRPAPPLERLISIQTFDVFKINIESYFLMEGLRIFQVSPVISIKPYNVEFAPLLPALIQIPLMIEPSPEDELHCLYNKTAVEDLEASYTEIPWKSVELGKYSIVKSNVYFETFHFGLFVVVIRPKRPFSTKSKNIRAQIGGKLIITNFPSMEIAFPKETQGILGAQAKVYIDTEETVSEFLANRLTKLESVGSCLDSMDTGEVSPEEDCLLATPILQLEPHGMQFENEPVLITLPVPDYDIIMARTNNTAKLSIWQSNTHSRETSVWERLDVEYNIRQTRWEREVITVVVFPVTHFSFFKGVWESISNYLNDAKIGMLYYFVSFAMKCQANMEEYGDQTTSTPTTVDVVDGEELQKTKQTGGSRFGLEVSVFQADKPWPQMATYKYKVGQSNPKLVKTGKICIRLKSHYFEPDVQAGEEEVMEKEEADFRGRDFQKQFICQFKPNVKIDRGPFGKVLVTRERQRLSPQVIFEFNIQKHGHEADVSPPDYQSEQWSIVALRELANNLFVTDGDNWKTFAQEAGMTKQEIRDSNLKNDADPFQKIVSHYRQRGGTPEELVSVLYRCHRTIKIRWNCSPQGSNHTKSSNGSSGRGSLSSNNANFDRIGSHDSDTSGKTSGTRTSQDSGLPPAGRKRSHQASIRGSGGGSSLSSSAKRKRLPDALPGPSRKPELSDEADEENSGSDQDRVPRYSTTAKSIVSDGQISQENDQTVLDSHFFWQISEYMNISNWRALGRTLGLEESVLIEVDHAYNKNSFRECSFQMLLEWKNRFPKRCTYAALYKALNKEGMSLVAKKMVDVEPNG